MLLEVVLTLWLKLDNNYREDKSKKSLKPVTSSLKNSQYHKANYPQVVTLWLKLDNNYRKDKSKKSLKPVASPLFRNTIGQIIHKWLETTSHSSQRYVIKFEPTCCKKLRLQFYDRSLSTTDLKEWRLHRSQELQYYTLY